MIEKNIAIAKDFPNKYLYIQDSQDLNALCDYFSTIEKDQITEAIVVVEDGEYKEVWVCYYTHPYDLNAPYEQIL